MKVRPELTSKYFKLLYEGSVVPLKVCIVMNCGCLLRTTSDVKHAASYVEERSTANVLADQFFA